MNTNLMGVNVVIVVAGFLMCLFCLTQAYLNQQMERTTRRFLIILFTVLCGYLLFNMAGQIVDDFHDPFFAMLQRVLLFFESFTAAAATPILLAFILYSCGERRWAHTAPFSIALAFLIFYLILLVTNEFTGAFYSVDIENVYRRGPYYPVLLVPPVAIMLVGLIAFWRRRSGLPRSQQSAFAAYLFVPMAFMVCQMLLYGVYAIALGTALGAFAMFVNFQADQRERMFRAEAETARLKPDIMLSQLQPHFLCNTLGAIGGLCENAVRHGIRGTEEGIGTVTISTCEYDDRWEVAAADDGAGFDPAISPSEDGRSHIGLKNVRTRLELVCRGKLLIDSEFGCGSVVTVVIPKEAVS